MLPTLLENAWSDPDFQRDYVSLAPPEAQTSPQAYQSNILDLTTADIKAPHLKKLQGLIWRQGYEKDDLVTPLFGDVEPTLKYWVSKGFKLAIFSSGSVEAQHMFFGHVEGTHGDTVHDLNPLFVGYFDTLNAGPKTEVKSYEKIATELDYPPARILFLSDNTNEIRAAQRAGMTAIVVDRPGNAPLSVEERKSLRIVESLERITLEAD